jgi:hypothetical protein
VQSPSVLSCRRLVITCLFVILISASFLWLGCVTGVIATTERATHSGGSTTGSGMAIGLFTNASTLSIPNGSDLVQTSGYSEPGKGQARYVFDTGVDAAYAAVNPRTSFVSANDRGFRLAELVINPLMAGAAGDGVTVDNVAVVAAGNYAFANERMLAGDGPIYGIDGDMTFAGATAPMVSNLNLKQLDPDLGQSTLAFLNCEGIEATGIRIHTGDAKGAGHMDNTVGLLVNGGSGHKIRNVVATGNGKVTYVRFWNCTDSTFENIHVHDGEFEDFEMAPEGFRVPDDLVQGIHLADCTNCNLVNPIVRDLLGNATYWDTAKLVRDYRNFRTRGIAGGGNTHCTVLDPQVSNVEQGIDFSGNGGFLGNNACTIEGGHTRDCGSVGVKFANAQQRCKAIGHIAENCGMMGFLISGSDRTYKNYDICFIGCTSINPGYNDVHFDTDIEPLAHCGFCVWTDAPGGCEGAKVVDCRSLDKQGFFLFGDDPHEPANPTTTWPGVGATRATMRYPWTAPSGSYSITFSTGETRTAAFTNGSTAVTWAGGLASAVTHPFVSRPGKMQYGFLNEAAYNPASARPNTAVNCESVGHIIAAEKGFHSFRCHMKGSGLQEVQHNSNTPLQWDVPLDNTVGMHAGPNYDRITFQKPGKYRIRGLLSFAPVAGAGYRRAQIKLNGATRFTFPYPAVPGENTVTPFDAEITVTAKGHYVQLFVEQTSGAPINIDRTISFIIVEAVGGPSVVASPW